MRLTKPLLLTVLALFLFSSSAWTRRDRSHSAKTDNKPYTHVELQKGKMDGRYYTEAEINNFVRLASQVGRANFTWKDADEIYLDGAVYYHAGRTKLVHWDSQLTFQFGSGGSNSDSDDLGASEWHYVYLDDSAIAAKRSPVITASELLNDTTAPGTYDHEKRGRYNGDDRCIGACLTDGSNNILEFFHDGGDLVLFADYIREVTADNVGVNWGDTDIDITSSVPGFATKVNMHFRWTYNNTTATLLWRINGQTGTSGHIIGKALAASTVAGNTLDIFTDSSQVFQLKESDTSTNTCDAWINGWYLPQGL